MASVSGTQSRKGSASGSVSELKRAQKENKPGNQGNKEDNADPCGVCDVNVDTAGKGIECEICKVWFHPRCVDLTDNEYEVLCKHKMGTIHWYCASCNVKSVELLSLVFGLRDKLQMSEKEMESMRKETDAKLSKLELQYDAVKEDIKILNKKIEEGMKKCSEDSNKMVKSLQQQTRDEIKEEIEEVKTTSFADIMKEELEKSLGNMATEIQTVKTNISESRATAEEQRDKESRRNNLILYNVTESTAARAEERNKEDVSFCLRLFNIGLQAGIAEEDLLHVFRLGKRGENEDDPPRPLLVQLGSYTQKNVIIESLYKLKHADAQYKKTVVSHDMTKTEREDCKKLVEEAKVRAAQDVSGEYLYRVRGPPGKMRIYKIKIRH